MNVQRHRTLGIAKPDEARISDLLLALRNLEGVNEVRIEQNKLKIVYTFPETGFDLIRAVIATCAADTAAQFSVCVAAGMEQIEREHLQASSGWDVYTRDIYVGLQRRESERRNRQPRKNWQQGKH